jgi:tRNA threonylcarbamoyladenosine biosynthesis protein TsaE
MTVHKADNNAVQTLVLPDEAATLALGVALARRITPGLVVYLYGNLGAGKTTLVRGLLRALGYNGRVKSPTYTLVEPYELPGLTLHHYDLYRMNDPREWLDAGFRDDFSGKIACIVEWPEKAAGLLPRPDVEIRIEMEGEGRRVRLSGATTRGREFLRELDAA